MNLITSRNPYCSTHAVLFSILLVLAAPVQSALPLNIAWIDWLNATPGTQGTAEGAIAADSEILVSYSGVVSTASTVVGSFPSWGPTTTFSGGTVGNPPTIHDMIVLAGGQPTINTITFSTPVINPVLAIWRLGREGKVASLQFSEKPFTVQSGGPSNEHGGVRLKVSTSGDAVTGELGNGTVQFIGEYTSISWVNTTLKGTYGFTLGIPRSSREECALGFSSPVYKISEAAARARIRVTRDGIGCPTASVRYSTLPGTAKPNENYENVNGTLHWHAGSTQTKVFDIPIHSDGQYQNKPLTIKLALSEPHPTDALGAPSTSILKISNVDAQPIVDFTITSACNPAEEFPCRVTFQESSSASFNITGSFWFFDDQPLVIGGGLSFFHDYTTAGTYHVRHVIETPEGSFETTKPIIVFRPFEFLVDEVIDLQTGGFGLVDLDGVQIALRSPSSGNKVTELAGAHAAKFKDLSTVADCPLCLVGYATYNNYVNATFWYQSDLGAWSTTDYNDGNFSGTTAGLLHNAVTMMSWALKYRMDELMSCAAGKAQVDIPNRYNTGLINGLVTDTLKRDLNYTFFFPEPFSVHIAIGGFNNPTKVEKDSSGNIISRTTNLGVTWSRVLDSRPERSLVTEDLPDFIKTDNSVLIGINQNVHSDAGFTLGTSAGNIFHELLHNFGFNHGDNELSSYADRSKALFALEDCMCKIVKNRVEAGNLPPDLRGVQWLGGNPPAEKKCRDGS
jgi:hypothetical protein